MGRSPCCSNESMNKGAWTAMEDKTLTDYIRTNGEGRWTNLPQKAGLKRCGKSCRLRWLNYLRPDIKRGNITADEEELIIRLHKLLGNRWSLIAGRLPGRTDNEIKNYWNTTLGKRAVHHVLNKKHSSTEITTMPSPSPVPVRTAALNNHIGDSEGSFGISDCVDQVNVESDLPAGFGVDIDSDEFFVDDLLVDYGGDDVTNYCGDIISSGTNTTSRSSVDLQRNK